MNVSLQSTVHSRQSTVDSLQLTAGSRQSTAASRRIRNAFSKAAVRYDELSGLQQEIGWRLLGRLNSENPQSILDIGMGTGWLTQKLCEKFPKAQVVGMDFAAGMIDCAKEKALDCKIVSADACDLPFKENSFDVVISNLTYQWVTDLAVSFSGVYEVLENDGTFYLSAFGHRTLEELFVSLRESFNGKRKDLRRLATQEDIRDALAAAGFQEIEVSSQILRINFKDTFALLRWLKNIGANALEHNIFVGKDLLKQADNFYRKNFRDNGNIYATFEVVWARARKQATDKRPKTQNCKL